MTDYRHTKHTHNNLDIPTSKWVCDYCQIPLKDKNRSVISTRIICLEHALYQICKTCRRNVQGKLSDEDLMKLAYLKVGGMEAKDRDKFWTKKFEQMEKMHTGEALPGLGIKNEQN